MKSSSSFNGSPRHIDLPFEQERKVHSFYLMQLKTHIQLFGVESFRPRRNIQVIDGMIRRVA